MADFARYLPLSQHEAPDSSAVSSDRRRQISELIVEAARLLQSAPKPEAAVLAANFARDAKLGRGIRPASSSFTPDDLSRYAVEVVPGQKLRIRHLADTLRALLLLAKAVDSTPVVPVLTSGAVALYASGRAPFERRAAISGHTVSATDAEWSFGSGPAISAPALQIAAFLLGVSEDPPRRPAAP
ncbi:hypothetical protein FHX49_000452 [Microbacterium endophyticum]|uniref:Uncharacterized protein n=1 Tax=Microbacterium endophyticum TaxID=1526412 RepID=A0A7W4V125_9MICO|nr:hypothetical protein [Microbacterium endophyticum]MBB2974911.1 hypothetical protein [Microbacterium endophyticum]NIK37208.1 hypothetical protein [Microbacterium endophyticum]